MNTESFDIIIHIHHHNVHSVSVQYLLSLSEIILLAAHLVFHMFPAGCLMQLLFVAMLDLKLLSAFHCRMASNVGLWMAGLLELAALQRRLGLNVGSYDDDGRV